VCSNLTPTPTHPHTRTPAHSHTHTSTHAHTRTHSHARTYARTHTAPFQSRENPKRRKRSDDEYKPPTIHRLSNTAPPGEYTKPVTTTISFGNTPASGGEEEALLTASETRTAQALDTIPVKPVKRTGEDADQFVEPITTTAPKKDNLGTASLTTIKKETHRTPTQTGSTDEVWQSHSNRKRDKVPHSPTPGTSSKQQVETSIENLGNRKRTGGSDDELQHPSTLLLDTTIPWPAKRSRGFTGEHVKPTTTSSRNAAPLTTHETEKSTLTDVSLSPVARVTHGSHPRTAGTHDGDSLTAVSPSQPDTKKCIQVGRETYAVQSQPRTSYDSISAIDSSSPSTPKGTDTYALRTELGPGHTPPKKYKKPRSGSQNNQPPSNPYKARHRPS
jgi:hypothetical protein